MESTTATFGIDLASKPARTGVCMIEWRPGERAYVHCPGTDADDHDLLAQIGKEYVTKVGIDAPFGWPSEFIEAINAYHAAGTWEPLSGDRLRLRETDRAVRDETGITPLSVSTDKIAIVAMRCAKLLAAHWQAGDHPPDRAGTGKPVEVYPAAALRQWHLSPKDDPEDPGSYKGSGPLPEARRRRLMIALTTRSSDWLEINEKTMHVCCKSDDCLDALLCALIARAVEVGQVLPISDQARASDEGWIALPCKELLPDLNGGSVDPPTVERLAAHREFSAS